jgi:hypothetical protein
VRLVFMTKFGDPTSERRDEECNADQ